MLRSNREVFDMTVPRSFMFLMIVAISECALTATADDDDLEFHGPFTHQNLAVYLITGEETVAPGTPIINLAAAMESKRLVVHETGEVNTLVVENTDREVAVFIQAGEIVKGGRQDRVLAADLLVRPGSGKVPIASFCVEAGRWSQREGEASTSFNTSSTMISGKGLRHAVKAGKVQGDVWQEVDKEQQKLSRNVGKDLRSTQSQSSLQLTLENADLARLAVEYTSALEPAVAEHAAAVGAAFCVNGEFRTADIYGSREIFSRQWPRLLAAAVHEAIADFDPENPSPVPADDWQTRIREGKAADERRETLAGEVEHIARTRTSVNEYETRDLMGGAVLHKSWDQKEN
jgi:hypothetical protein